MGHPRATESQTLYSWDGCVAFQLLNTTVKRLNEWSTASCSNCLKNLHLTLGNSLEAVFLTIPPQLAKPRRSQLFSSISVAFTWNTLLLSPLSFACSQPGSLPPGELQDQPAPRCGFQSRVLTLQSLSAQALVTPCLVLISPTLRRRNCSLSVLHLEPGTGLGTEQAFQKAEAPEDDSHLFFPKLTGKS